MNCGHISSIPNCYFEFIISYFLFTFTSGRLITCSHDHEAVSAESSLHLNVSGVHLFVQRVAPVGDERCHFFFFFTEPYRTVPKRVSGKSRVFETRHRQAARVSSSPLCQTSERGSGEALDGPN